MLPAGDPRDFREQFRAHKFNRWLLEQAERLGSQQRFQNPYD